MIKSKIVRVWGKADNFDIEFSKCNGSVWTCCVPPDTSDGMYAVQIFAINEFQEQAAWAGFLYMCSGVCHLDLNEKAYGFYVQTNNLNLEISSKKPSFKGECSAFDFEVSERKQIKIMKGCYHVRTN